MHGCRRSVVCSPSPGSSSPRRSVPMRCDGVVLLDAAVRIVEVNVPFLEMTGLARAELRGAAAVRVLAREGPPGADALFAAALEGQEAEREGLPSTRC